MQAKDIMTTPVVTVTPDASVRDVAQLLLKNHISAVPVVDESDQVVGIVSEGDLIHRAEIGTERPKRSWWLSLIADGDRDARNYVKAHAARVGDLMTRDVVTVSRDAPLQEIAECLERHGIKRVPVVKGRRLMGIVSRANLLQALAAQPAIAPSAVDNQQLRTRVETILRDAPWSTGASVNPIVQDGIVHLWGYAESDDQRRAIRIAVEELVGAESVKDHLTFRPLHHSGY